MHSFCVVAWYGVGWARRTSCKKVDIYSFVTDPELTPILRFPEPGALAPRTVYTLSSTCHRVAYIIGNDGPAGQVVAASAPATQPNTWTGLSGLPTCALRAPVAPIMRSFENRLPRGHGRVRTQPGKNQSCLQMLGGPRDFNPSPPRLTSKLSKTLEKLAD